MSVRLGVVFRPDLDPATLQQTARAVDSAGIDELWLWEDCFLQGGIAAATAALAATDNVTVGIGVLPAPLRNVVTTAMEIASVEAMFPGRIRVGIGHGIQDWMRQAGAAVASPLTLLREYVSALARLLAGEAVTVDGRYVRLDDVRLDWPPAQPLPILVGGTGPKTLRLAGEIAGGVILDSQYSPTGVVTPLGHVAEGRVDSGGEAFSTVLFVAGAPDAGDAVRYLAAGVDTLVFQPTGASSEMPAFVAAAADAAARIRSAATR